MNCEQCSECVSDYLEDLLSPERRASVDTHCASCAKCRTMVQELRAIPQLVRSATDVPMPEAAQRRLLGRLREPGQDKK